jgi:ABC-type uncharacterized transport system substrate-binding protein
MKTRLLLFLLLLAIPLHAHPHLFIKVALEIIHKENVINGVKVGWKWDKVWSEQLINDFDADKDMSFNEKEKKDILDNFNISLKDYSYFTKIFINGKKIAFKSITDFDVSIGNDKTVTYTFVIPFNHVLQDKVVFNVRFNDDTIYVAFDSNIAFSIAGSEQYTVSNLKMDVYSYFGVELAFAICRRGK